MNIQDGNDKGFGSREREYYMVVNDYQGPILTNRPHATPNYGPGKLSLKLIITDIHIFL